MEAEDVKTDRNEFVEDGILWTKLSHTKTFDEDPQQMFKVNRDECLVLKIDEDYHALNGRCPHAGLSLKGGTTDSKNQTINCEWHHSSFCYKTGEVREWLKLSWFEQFLGKIFLKDNKQAEGMMEMEPTPVETFQTKIIDDYVWIGIDQSY